MGSEGSEFDSQDDFEPDSREHLQRQRALLNEKLGFNQAGININDLVSLDDMRAGTGIRANSYDPNQRLQPVQELLYETNDSLPTDLSSHSSSSSSAAAAAAAAAAALSCREINRARRKARQNPILIAGCQPSTISRSNSNGSMGDDGGGPERKIAKIDLCREPVGGGGGGGDAVPDGTGAWPDSCIDWPLETFCSRLYLDLFNPRWETRHGAATALRELLKSHSAGAGKTADQTKWQQDQAHMLWLEDAVLRLLCVLALDRFGDFISDQVVAPVRETCAQVLGTIMKDIPLATFEATIRILLGLVQQSEWEVRHGGLLGIKYVMVVREDLLQTCLPMTINHILAGLFDHVDDVGAVAASTLIPIASWLPKLLTAAQVSSIVKILWDLLLEQDELTSACNSFMGLLSAILSLPDASKWIQMEPMAVLIPRLWPFLSHTTSSVRRSTLQTLKTLTEISGTTNHSISVIMKQENGNSNGHAVSVPAVRLENRDIEKVLRSDYDRLELNFGVKNWPPHLLQEALRHIYQRVLVEHLSDIQSLVESVWTNLVTHADLSALLHAACPFVAAWMCLAMQPARMSFDPAQMIYPKMYRVSYSFISNCTNFARIHLKKKKHFLYTRIVSRNGLNRMAPTIWPAHRLRRPTVAFPTNCITKKCIWAASKLHRPTYANETFHGPAVRPPKCLDSCPSTWCCRHPALPTPMPTKVPSIVIPKFWSVISLQNRRCNASLPA